MEGRRSAVPALISGLCGVGLPIVATTVFRVLAIIVRVRWLAIATAFVTLGLGVAWFASETFRPTRADSFLPQSELGAWLALGGAVLMVVAAFMTPRWELQVR